MALDLPPIYLLKFNFDKDPYELHRLEKKIGVVWNIKEARLVLGRISHKKRAEHELRKLGLNTEDVDVNAEDDDSQPGIPPPKKKRKSNPVNDKGKEVISLDSDSESAINKDETKKPTFQDENIRSMPKGNKPLVQPGMIKVLKLSWYTESLEAGELLPVDQFLVYEGRIVDSTAKPQVEKKVTKLPSFYTRPSESSSKAHSQSFHHHGGHHPRSQNSHSSQQPPLLQADTVDHDVTLPPIPDYLHARFCCQRPTSLHCPNEAFLAQLRIVEKGRELTGEAMRARAYNGAIATIASYPYTITSWLEIVRLPSCGEKIASVWKEWIENGYIQEAKEFQEDQRFNTLSLFCDIHDVGYKNALKFWQKGWRDLDDIIEYGWQTLTRNQQIGVKYLSEFQTRIPRPEVESIANIILDYANRLHPGFQMVICGGYRRGKATSGDVDVILSHSEEEATDFVLKRLLDVLEEHGWLTHILEFSVTNSKRGQQTLGWKGNNTRTGSGFDTLDHAFIVWQDPSWPTKEADLSENPSFKNPNIHRRVDIIISPWKTAGCAVLGWSGANMFERDLRRYTRSELGWKFDSSGVRNVATGQWMDLEGDAKTMEEKEKRVFAGLKLEWREPTERCTD